MPTFLYDDWTSCHTRNWRRWLADLVDRPVIGVEVGALEGRSSVWFLENVLNHPGSRLYCIDPWGGSCYSGEWRGDVEGRFDSNIAPYRNRVIKLKAQSFSILPRLICDKLRVDFCYVDGLHEGWAVLMDALDCWRLLRPGGCMFLDDYKWIGPKGTISPGPAMDALKLILPHDPERFDFAEDQMCFFKPKE